jgi:hypothetical protein
MMRMVVEKDAAEILGIPQRTLYNERRVGRIGYRRVAGRIPIKIGFTSWEDPQHRMALLQSGNPERLRLICEAPGDRYSEKALHREFADDRMVGEWFACSARLLDLIKRIKAGAAIAEALKPQQNTGQENAGRIPVSSRNVPQNSVAKS